MHAQVRFGAMMSVCALVVGAITLADDAPQADDQPDLKPLVAQVRQLVAKYYPKAKVGLEGQTIHFEHNTRKFMIHEPFLTGEWQDAHEEIGPQKGGIFCDIELRASPYNGMAAAPQSFDKRYFIVLLMAPYSEKLDHHLYVHLLYPRDVRKDFLEEFGNLMDGFEEILVGDGH